VAQHADGGIVTDSHYNSTLMFGRYNAVAKLMQSLRSYFCDYYGVPENDTANIVCNCIFDPVFGISITAPKNATKNIGKEPRADKMADMMQLAAAATMETLSYRYPSFNSLGMGRFNKLLVHREAGSIGGVVTKGDETALGLLLKHAADTGKTPADWPGGATAGEIARQVVERALSALGGSDLGKRVAIRNALLKGTDQSLSESMGQAVLGEAIALVLGTMPRQVYDATTWKEAMTPVRSMPPPCLYAVFYERTSNKATQVDLWALHAGVCRLLGDFSGDGTTIPYILGYVQILSAMAVVGGYDFGVQWPFVPASADISPNANDLPGIGRFPYSNIAITIMRQADAKGEATYGVNVFDGARKMAEWPVPIEKANAASDLMSCVFKQVHRNGIYLAVPGPQGRVAMVTADKYATINGMRLAGNGQIGLPPALNWTGVDLTGVLESAVHQIREIVNTSCFRNTMLATRAYARGGALVDADAQAEKEPEVDAGDDDPTPNV
jgi:hypothetical protein